MGLGFENLFKIGLSTFGVFLSLGVFLFLLAWYFKVVWHKIVEWNFLGIVVLQFSIFVFSVLILLEVFDFFSLNTNVRVFFYLFFNWAIATYFIFMDKDISLPRKISVLSVLLLILLTLVSNNGLIVGVLVGLILVFLFFNVIVVFLSSVKLEVFVDFVFFCIVFLGSVVYYFGYMSWGMDILVVCFVSTFVVVRALSVLIFFSSYLNDYRKSVKNDVSSISSIMEQIYLVWDDLSAYKNSTQKLVFMLNEDTKRVYSYFRYIGSIISSFYDKVQGLKFSFERYVDETKLLRDKIDSFLGSLDSLNNNYLELGKMLDYMTAKVEKDILFFRNFSDELNLSLSALKEMKDQIQESIRSMEDLLMMFSKITKEVSFVEQVSIEGNISSRNYGFYILSNSFANLKNYSSHKIQEILMMRNTISHLSRMYYGAIERIEELQDDVYRVLSFSDAVVNLLKSVSSSLNNIEVRNIKGEKLVELRKKLDENVISYESVKEEMVRNFETIEKMLSTIETTSEKISTLATSIVYVVDIMEFLSKNFDTISYSLKSLKNEVDSILG